MQRQVGLPHTLYWRLIDPGRKGPSDASSRLMAAMRCSISRSVMGVEVAQAGEFFERGLYR